MKIALKLLLGICLFSFGEYLGYKVFTSYNQNNFVNLFGILAFVLTLSGIVTVVYIPIFYLNKLYYKFKDNNKVLANTIWIPIIILTISIIAIPLFVFFNFSNKYHKSQIDNYGVVQTIIIDSESHGKNSNNYSYFRFNANGKLWKGSLYTWRYKIKDSAKIIYSSQNPNEVEWYEKYKLKNK